MAQGAHRSVMSGRSADLIGTPTAFRPSDSTISVGSTEFMVLPSEAGSSSSHSRSLRATSRADSSFSALDPVDEQEPYAVCENNLSCVSAAGYPSQGDQLSQRTQTDGRKLEPDDAPKMRRKVKLYSPGDVVELYSTKHKRWMMDAEVAEVLTETSHQGGMKIRAGSTKVIYASGSRFQWVAPQQMELLRPSKRPPAPDRMTGALQTKDQEAWLARWSTQWVDLRLGRMRWWGSKELAQSGKEESGALNLLNIEIKLEGMVMKLTHTQVEEVYSFSAASASEASTWSAALTAHAAYAVALKDLARREQGAAPSLSMATDRGRSPRATNRSHSPSVRTANRSHSPSVRSTTTPPVRGSNHTSPPKAAERR